MSHQIAFFVAIFPLAWLVHRAPTPKAALCCALYAVSLLALLGISATYHRKHWPPAPRAVMRNLDHSAVFLLIAGTYTPICLLAVGGLRGTLLCAAIWAGALLGIAQTLFWPGAPRSLHVGIYVLLGWAGALGLSAEMDHIGWAGTRLHVLGGIIYTLGAIAYARKRPDPVPHIFGYHEIFHALVLLACALLFAVVRRCMGV